MHNLFASPYFLPLHLLPLLTSPSIQNPGLHQQQHHHQYVPLQSWRAAFSDPSMLSFATSTDPFRFVDILPSAGLLDPVSFDDPRFRMLSLNNHAYQNSDHLRSFHHQHSQQPLRKPATVLDQGDLFSLLLQDPSTWMGGLSTKHVAEQDQSQSKNGNAQCQNDGENGSINCPAPQQGEKQEETHAQNQNQQAGQETTTTKTQKEKPRWKSWSETYTSVYDGKDQITRNRIRVRDYSGKDEVIEERTINGRTLRTVNQLSKSQEKQQGISAVQEEDDVDEHRHGDNATSPTTASSIKTDTNVSEGGRQDPQPNQSEASSIEAKEGKRNSDAAEFEHLWNSHFLVQSIFPSKQNQNQKADREKQSTDSVPHAGKTCTDANVVQVQLKSLNLVLSDEAVSKLISKHSGNFDSIVHSALLLDRVRSSWKGEQQKSDLELLELLEKNSYDLQKSISQLSTAQ